MTFVLDLEGSDQYKLIKRNNKGNLVENRMKKTRD